MNFDKRLLTLVKSVRLWLALTVILGVLGGGLLVVQAWLLSQAINAVFLGGAGLAGVAALLAAIGIVALTRAGITWLAQITGHEAAARIKSDLRERLFAHLLALGPAYTQGEQSGELVNTALNGVEELDAYFSQYLPQVALAALVPLTYLLFVIPADPLSALVLALTAPLIPLFMVLIGNLAQRLTRRQWGAISRLSAHFLDVLNGLTTLKQFNRSRRQIAVIRRIDARWRATTLGVLRVAFLSALALELIATLSTAIVAVEIGIRLLYGRLIFEQALFVLILAPEFYIPLRQLGVRFHAGLTGVAAAERIFAVLETPVDVGIIVPHRLAGASRQAVSSECHIRFEDVHYAYADGTRAALSGVTFALPPGQITALVGPSGAGKSTAAALLLRFITPTAGMITVDDVPLNALPPAEWRSRLAWVPQTPYLFNASVIDNIRLGRPEASPDEVIYAAQQAAAHDFIRELPDGYQTGIGERGTRLSGGQAQRIALARAFMRDAPLIILDEATANLDAASEALITAALDRLLKHKTALVIAHRLRTVQSAGQIVVLQEGQVAEVGTPADLAAQSGLYARLLAAYPAAGQAGK